MKYDVAIINTNYIKRFTNGDEALKFIYDHDYRVYTVYYGGDVNGSRNN